MYATVAAIVSLEFLPREFSGTSDPTVPKTIAILTNMQIVLNTQDEMKIYFVPHTKHKDWVAIKANAKHNYKQCLGFRRCLNTIF